MKKLIELLKQFDIKSGRQYPEYKIEKGIVYNVYHNPFEGDEYIDWTLNIISKKFGFIKRLFENDKIDFSPIPNRIKEIGIPMKINGEIKYGFDSSDYYWLLMLLSIQDNPIEFLCEILK